MSTAPVPAGDRIDRLPASDEEAARLAQEATGLVSLTLDTAQLDDLELLLGGGFAPLDGYMRAVACERVCREMRLPDGTLFPLPVLLEVSRTVADGVPEGARVALRHPEGMLLAVLSVDGRFEPDRAAMCEALFGTTDAGHPGAARVMARAGQVALSGRVEGVALPAFHGADAVRPLPGQLAQAHTGAPLYALHFRDAPAPAVVGAAHAAAASAGGHLLINPLSGPTQATDVDASTRLRIAHALARSLPPGSASVTALPFATRLAGPREALAQMLVRARYGVTHMFVGPHHAEPHGRGSAHRQSARGEQPPDDARAAEAALRLCAAHAVEAGVEVVPLQTACTPDGARIGNGTLRAYLDGDEALPDWLAAPDVAAVLRERYPTPAATGFVLFFTGLSGSGKSTIANRVVAALEARGPRRVTLLDGDLVRTHLSSELGFSREHRNINVARLGFVAAEVARHGGAAVCAPIAPYAEVRQQVRDMVQANGRFVEVYVATPLEVCEARDPKGLYVQARAGRIKQFTGIDDPYEAPTNAEVVIDTQALSPAEACDSVLAFLEAERLLRAAGG